jgi:hypothetical protein
MQSERQEVVAEETERRDRGEDRRRDVGNKTEGKSQKIKYTRGKK